MAPLPCASITGSAARVIRTVVVRFSARVRSQSASLIARKPPAWNEKAPTLFTRYRGGRSGRPIRRDDHGAFLRQRCRDRQPDAAPRPRDEGDFMFHVQVHLSSVALPYNVP